MSIKSFTLADGSTDKYDYNYLENKPEIHNMPSGGTQEQVLKKSSGTDYDATWADESVTDVQINGTSIVENGVAEIPIASGSDLGVVKVDNQTLGLYVNSNQKLSIAPAGESTIKASTDVYKPIVPLRQHIATFFGLAKASGDTTQSQSSNEVGVYTNEAKAAIWNMLGLDGTAFKSDWELIREYTVTEDTTTLNITTDDNGGTFELSEMFVRAWLEPATTGTNSFVSAANLIKLTNNTNSVTSAPTKRYMANGAKTFFQYQSTIINTACVSTGSSSSTPNSTSTLEVMSSPVGTNVASFYGFRLSRYGDSGSLIPKDSVIKIYGKRKHGIIDSPIVNVSGATPVITALPGHRYICGEVTTVSFTPSATGICNVIFESGTTATVLTVPNTVKFPLWFDATALEANTIYEISVVDGVYGAVMTWAA